MQLHSKTQRLFLAKYPNMYNSVSEFYMPDSASHRRKYTFAIIILILPM